VGGFQDAARGAEGARPGVIGIAKRGGREQDGRAGGEGEFVNVQAQVPRRETHPGFHHHGRGVGRAEGGAARHGPTRGGRGALPRGGCRGGSGRGRGRRWRDHAGAFGAGVFFGLAKTVQDGIKPRPAQPRARSLALVQNHFGSQE